MSTLWMQNSKKNLFLLCIFSIAVTIIAGCGGPNILVPFSDETPPAAFLEVSAFGGTFTLDASSGRVERVLTDPLEGINFVVKGIDEDGAVRNVALKWHTIDCFGSSGPAHHTYTEPSAAGPGEAAPRELVLDSPWGGAFETDIRNCIENGWEVPRLEHSFWAYAENFHGGIDESATFTIIYLPPSTVILDEDVELPENITPLPEGLEFEIPSPIPLIPFASYATSCWEGPGSQYPLLVYLQEGTRLTLLGIAQTGSWFIIEPADSPGVECWVDMSAIDVDANLDFSSLNIYPIPPVPSNGVENGSPDGGQDNEEVECAENEYYSENTQQCEIFG